MIVKRSKSRSWMLGSKSQDSVPSSQPPTQVGITKRDEATRISSMPPGSGKNGFFARFTSPSSAKTDPASRSRPTSQPEPPSPQTTIPGSLAMRSLSPDLYDDPAFSPDPRSHPLFVTNPDPPSSSPVSGLSGFLPFSTQSTSINLREEASIRPPNSPNGSSEEDQLDFSFSTTPSTSHSSSLETASSPPSSYESMPLVKLQKLSSVQDPQTVVSVQPVHDADPDRPSAARHTSAPEFLRDKPQVDVPVRPGTAPIKASQPAAASLDPIDEMDESNPVGISFHHGSPYEVASKYSTAAPVDATVSHLSRSLTLDRHNARPVPTIPFVPFGASLNLRPGQVIPHNFQPYVDPPPPQNPNQSNPSMPQNHPQPRQQSAQLPPSQPHRQHSTSRSPPPPYVSRSNTPLQQQLQNLQLSYPTHPNAASQEQSLRIAPSRPSPQQNPAPSPLLPNPWTGPSHRRRVSDILEVSEDEQDPIPEKNIYGGIEEEDEAYEGDGTLVGALGSWFEPQDSVIPKKNGADVDASSHPHVNPIQTEPTPRPVELDTRLPGPGSRVQGYQEYNETEKSSSFANGVPFPNAYSQHQSPYVAAGRERVPLAATNPPVGAPIPPPNFANSSGAPFVPYQPHKHTSLPSPGYAPDSQSAGPPKVSVAQRHFSMDNHNGYLAGGIQTANNNLSAEYPHERPLRTPAPSIQMSIASSTATNGGLRPRHIPKQLVMPAPLQGQPRSHSTTPNFSQRPNGSGPLHPRSHSVSPTSSAPFSHSSGPAMGPPPKPQKASGVLRKRSSIISVKNSTTSVSSVSWERIEAQALDRSVSDGKMLKGKAPKRLLSKRR